MNRIAALVAGAMLLAACGVSPGPGQIIDGFPIGEPFALGPGEVDRQTLAMQALDSREPGHLAIVAVSTFREDLANTTIFPEGRATRSGTVTVFVFTFADGSHAATGVYCGVPPCVPFETYPH